MTDTILALLDLGLAGIACVAFAEKLVPVVPSYLVLMFLGMAAAENGHALPVLLLVTAAASTLGSMLWYAGGRLFGPARAAKLVERFGKYVFLRPETYRRLASAYGRNHFSTTLTAQLVPTVRIYLAIPAGAFRLAALPFAIATFLGCALWNAIFIGLGYMIRDTGQNPADLGFRVIVVVLLIEGAWMLALRRKARRRLGEQELAAR
ncbi:membrane protein DedA with SNARE-associated domain [Mesorhizobium soli]|uniref:DedA family protein n=1 Tax=Pseudaminobacter soli (ex Li et al. 2025) TaxID=1295366 RepID=UPI00247396FB|nr:DedA family protein [Mesorhizobium soli]MDH6230589.1 membrane protein DedA with SNARE-associated domain [Mesorhizobium soli]